MKPRNPDDPPEPGSSADYSKIFDLYTLDQTVIGWKQALIIEIGNMRAEVPYATEVGITLRWRASDTR